MNDENKKLIKIFNNDMRKKIGCENFLLEYNYKEKNLYIKQVQDTGILTKAGKRKFKIIKEKPVFDMKENEEPLQDWEIYLYLIGMLQAIDMVAAFTEQIRKSIMKTIPNNSKLVN